MLNDTQIRNLKPIEKTKKYFDGGDMYLLMTANGSKLWRMVYSSIKSKSCLVSGEFPTVSFKDAQERRENAKRLLAFGHRPRSIQKDHNCRHLS